MANCHNNILCVINQVFTVRHDNWNNEEGEVEALGCLCSISPTQKHASKNVTEIKKGKVEVSSSCSTGCISFLFPSCPPYDSLVCTVCFFCTEKRSWQLINAANGEPGRSISGSCRRPHWGRNQSHFHLGKSGVKYIALWFVSIPHERWIDFRKQAEIHLRHSSTAAKLSLGGASTHLCPLSLSTSPSYNYSYSPASPCISKLDIYWFWKSKKKKTLDEEPSSPSLIERQRVKDSRRNVSNRCFAVFGLSLIASSALRCSCSSATVEQQYQKK